MTQYKEDYFLTIYSQGWESIKQLVAAHPEIGTERTAYRFLANLQKRGLIKPPKRGRKPNNPLPYPSISISITIPNIQFCYIQS